LFSENRRKSADLRSECSSNMLRGIRNQVLHSCHDVVEECSSVDQLAEAWILSKIM
jgi:hypothetical protein